MTVCFDRMGGDQPLLATREAPMDPWPDLPDADLVKQARAGERGAWTALTRRHSSRLWAIARGLRLGEADAADAVQTTWLRLVLMADPPPTYAEVSATLRMPIGSIGPVRQRCLGKLRTIMAEGPYSFESRA